MSRLRFWVAIVLAAVLGLMGFILGGIMPQLRILFVFLGVLIGFLTYGPITAWVIKTSTRFAKYLIATLASEILNQITNFALRGRPLIPIFREDDVPQKYEQLKGALILDTSSIIDGRFLDVAKTGFLPEKIILPEFILRELQQVADSADPLKRARGRKGFEMVNQLKRLRKIQVVILENQLDNLLGDLKVKSVDEKLVGLGRALKAKILTSDFNLNRMASIRGVVVLNLNELSNALKTLPLPGEQLKVKIVHLGKDQDQGVGYLVDGTMVVVKEANDLLGQEIETTVTKTLQGPSGRIVFGKLVSS